MTKDTKKGEDIHRAQTSKRDGDDNGPGVLQLSSPVDIAQQGPLVPEILEGPGYQDIITRSRSGRSSPRRGGQHSRSVGRPQSWDKAVSSAYLRALGYTMVETSRLVGVRHETLGGSCASPDPPRRPGS